MFLGEEIKCNLLYQLLVFPEPTQPHLFYIFFLTKKGERLFLLFLLAQGRFLSNRSVAKAIATIIAIPMPIMQVSVGGKAITGYGDGVGGAESIVNEVTACEGQQDSEPANEA